MLEMSNVAYLTQHCSNRAPRQLWRIHAAVTALMRRTVAEDKFPFSPRLKPLKSALAKLALQPVKPRKELPPLPSGPMIGSRRKARRVT
jgi:hypothetical protein